MRNSTYFTARTASPPRIAGFVLAAIMAVATVATAQDRGLAGAEQAYSALDFEGALDQAQKVVERGNLDHDTLVRATRVAALSQAALGQTDQARQSFVLLMTYDPTFKLDPRLGRRYQEPYSEAKGFWASQQKQESLDVSVVVKADTGGVLRVSTNDPGRAVKQIVVGYRWGNESYATQPLRETGGQVDVPASTNGATRLDYYVQALDGHSNVVLESGTQTSPKSTIVAPVSGQKSSGKSSSVFASPFTWVAAAVVLVGAGVGTYFAVRPTDTNAATSGRISPVLNCGGSRCE